MTRAAARRVVASGHGAWSGLGQAGVSRVTTVQAAGQYSYQATATSTVLLVQDLEEQKRTKYQINGTATTRLLVLYYEYCTVPCE